MALDYTRLHCLKAWKLKRTAFLMGLPSTGTKHELSTIVHEKLSAPLPFNGGRIVSVDMGIRNLALCVLDVPPLNIEQRPISRPAVLHWLKKDLLASTASTNDDRGKENPHSSAEVTKDQTREYAITPENLPKNAFTPSELAKTAYAMTMQLLSYDPDIILIERQRFRSGGSAAILEWTVRVNMLESMLWACLQTMRESKIIQESNELLAVHEVSPQRVANFWTTGPEISLRPADNLFTHSLDEQEASLSPSPDPKAKKAVRKAEKIAIARSWLDGSDLVDAPLTFRGEAAKTAAAFEMRRRKGIRVATDHAAEEPIGKLDDLADCLLQAVAWVRWEENRRDIGRLLSKSD